MQVDTLGISVCGFKSHQMNSFLNTGTNIMNLQFGNDKCEKMHIGKKRNTSICPMLSVDSWKENLQDDEQGKKILRDIDCEKEYMKEVTEKKYLGDIISHDGKKSPQI